MIEKKVYYVGNSKKRLAQILAFLPKLFISPEDDIEIEIRQRRKEKTPAQRGKWHCLCREFGRHIGLSLEECKDMIKQIVLGTKTITRKNGDELEIVQSSEREDRIGYSELIEHTFRIAAEEGYLLSGDSHELS